MSPRRAVRIAALLLAMAAFGTGTYVGLGLLKHTGQLAAAGADPVNEKPRLVLPGTVFLAQGGAVYALRAGSFTQLLPKPGNGSWTQPTLTGDGRLLVVLRGDQWSDLYLADRDTGRLLGALTDDNAGQRKADGSLEYDHWIFYPRVSPDGRRLALSFDSPKAGYKTAFAVWTMPLPEVGASLPSPSPLPISTDFPPASGPQGAVRQTTPNDYSGGDVMPIPLSSGGLLFVRYSFDRQLHVHSAIWFQASASDQGVPLTDPDADCGDPSLAPDGTTLAMICLRQGGQSETLEVATLAPAARNAPPATPEATLSRQHVVLGGVLCASPAWAPDGAGLVFLAPKSSGGRFQLWWMASASGEQPAKPALVTEGLSLDATSVPAWDPR